MEGIFVLNIENGWGGDPTNIFSMSSERFCSFTHTLLQMC